MSRKTSKDVKFMNSGNQDHHHHSLYNYSRRHSPNSKSHNKSSGDNNAGGGGGGNVYRIPTPLSPTFISTQSLVCMPPQITGNNNKKDKLSYSAGFHKQGNNQHLPMNLQTNDFIVNKGSSYLPSTLENNSCYVGNNSSKQQQNVDSKSFSANEDHVFENNKNTGGGGGRRVNKAQVYLPGDQVVFAESPTAPGVPIVYRLEEDRRSNPDKLNLDRRKLSECPILEGEEHLRLLNYQHNYIKKIEHLDMLRKLIFLDLYDNQIEEMSGLSSLKLLRVLMLGKNRITKISDLQELIMLDVLDLHGNYLKKIENIDHLRHLRVLNLAGNQLTVVDSLVGLTSLSELNLRRNSIHSVHDIGDLPSLQRLFLSFNDIKHYNDIICLDKSTSLIELSLDGNPFSKCSDYKQLLIRNISSLRQLDMKKLTDEEKRFVIDATKREEERQKENERLSLIKEKRNIAISNAEKQWSQQLKCKINKPALPGLFESDDERRYLCSNKNIDDNGKSCPLKSVDRVKSLSSSSLAELDHTALNLYGSGSLEALDKDWGEKAMAGITIINFKYINFDEITPYLCKLCQSFPSLKNLNFDMTNISTLNNLTMFSSLLQLESLNITSSGNYVTKLSLWKPYAIYCLSHTRLKTLNNCDVTQSDVDHAKSMFEPINNVMRNKLPKYRNLLRPRFLNIPVESSRIDCLWLGCYTVDEEKKADIDERKNFSVSYLNEVTQNGVLGDRKTKLLDDTWDKFIFDLIKSCRSEMDGLERYCEASLDKIKKAVNATALV